MGWRSKVIWSQGMYLLPHHFQQEARYVERLVDARVRCVSPFAWGFSELVLDAGLLAQGRIGLARAAGVMPDGTPFCMPQLDALPDPLDIDPALKGEVIHLALPLQREGLGEISMDDDTDAAITRFRTVLDPVHDNTDAAAEPEEVQTGVLGMRLLRARDLTDAYLALGVAEVAERRSDGMVKLEGRYVPPQVVCDASGHLSEALGLIHGLVRMQGHGLASRMGQPGHGVSEISDFLMLQLLNRNEPVLRQLTEAPSLHPRQLFDLCLQLAGELSTFTPSQRRPGEFALYRHDDLRGSFDPLFASLREMLTRVPDPAAVHISLADWGHSVRKALVKNLDLVRASTFVLAVGAQLPGEHLRRRFPDHAKVAPADDQFMRRVNGNLEGIALHALGTVPRELPFHAGYQYFEVDRGGDLWQRFEATGALALHVANEASFPGLELELWAIRRQDTPHRPERPA